MLYKGQLVTEYYHIKSEKLNRSPKITAAFLTDLHNCQHGVQNVELLEQIHKSNPDFILCAGDMLVGKAGHSMEVPLNLMKQLAEEYPVYYANGNHEKRLYLYPEQYGTMYEEYMGALEQMGITILKNESIDLNEYGIRIYGLDMDRCYYKRFCKTSMEASYLTDVLGWPEQTSYNILLAHNPLYNPEYAYWGADLVLSGHVHGGLIQLPYIGGVLSPQVRFFPKYCSGHYHLKKTDMIVSRGLGTHSINIRLNNPPELSVIDLQGKQ